MPEGRTNNSGYGSPAVLRIDAALQEHLLAGRADGGGQRIAGAQRFVEIGLGENDVLGLQHDGVAATFDIDGAATRAIGTIVGNDGIRFRTVGGCLLGLGQSLLGLGDPAFDLPQFLFTGSDEAARFQSFVGGLFGLPGEFLELIAEPPAVVFDMAQHQPGLGQLGLGFLARLLQLFDPPLDHFHFRGDAGLLLGVLGRRFLDGLQARLASDEEQQEHERPHRADQHGEERKQREARGPSPGTRCVAAVPGQPKRFHAAFEVRRFDSS